MNKNTLLKICGIRSLKEIIDLQHLDIDYFGCIFAKSPRQVDIPLAREITSIAHKNNKKTVGVFVNETIDNIINIIKETKIDRIQLHGNESPQFCKELLEQLKILNKNIKNNIQENSNKTAINTSKNIIQHQDIKLWKVFSVKDKLPDLTPYLPYIEYPLFDTKGENKGGNGIVFDWTILNQLNNQPFILAGGLSIKNITTALTYNPTILDVNSKVEINDRKNKQLIEEIINIVKNKFI